LAFLIRPSTDKPIPATAVRCRINGIECVRWSKRGGGTVTGLVLPNGKCRVTSPTWWVEYRDAHGVRRRERVSRDRAAAEHRKAQIVVDVERQKGGLLPKAALPTGETLTALADEYRRHLEDMGRTDQHASDTHRRIVAVLAECRWTTAADVTVGRWVRWVGESRKAWRLCGGHGEPLPAVAPGVLPLAGPTTAHRLPADPLAAAELLNADADRRIRRRALSAAEFRRLIDSTRASKAASTWTGRAGRRCTSSRPGRGCGPGCWRSSPRTTCGWTTRPRTSRSRPGGRSRGGKCASRFPGV
jgi:hypothetical protein